MQNKDSLISELEMVHSFRDFTEVYQEISVMRMQRIRQSVLRNREFQKKLAEVYYDVKHSYENEVLKIELKKQQKHKGPLALFMPKRKSLAILLTSSGRLYGDIFRKVFTLFKQHITTEDVDIMIIGRIGKQLYEDHNLKKKYIYFEIPDREIKYADLTLITNNLVNYDTINVYYGRFENIVTQTAKTGNITGDTVEDVKTNITKDKKDNLRDQKRFLFEPSLENVLHFFDTQVFASLFKQSIHESDLARFASRIQAMEKASSNIEDRLKLLSGKLLREDKLLDNKKQLERISGITLWRT